MTLFGDFNSDAVKRTTHRPWPLPDRPWLLTQTWNDLLFAHWPIAPEVLRPLVPSAFTLDVFEETAWIGVVPFRMTNVAPRGTPALPWVSTFPEANVRTYVKANRKHGIY